MSPCSSLLPFFFFNDTATTEIYTLSLHDALPISCSRSSPAWASTGSSGGRASPGSHRRLEVWLFPLLRLDRSEEHTSELQSRSDLVCRLLLEKKKRKTDHIQFRRKLNIARACVYY